MKEMGFYEHVTDLIRSLYHNQEATVRTESGDIEWFTIGQGVRQGCILSPYLFNIYAEYIMRRAYDGVTGQMSVGGRKINNLRSADDTTLIAKSSDELQDIIDRVKASSEEFGLHLNVKKTKTMVCRGDANQQVKVDGEVVEQVDTFNFLGSLIDKCRGQFTGNQKTFSHGKVIRNCFDRYMERQRHF